MGNFLTLLQQGNSWLFMPSAVLLGALHGLEPGHSKTMMAAFIIAIRGTLTQAILLGLAATVSHTAVVWAVALGGLYFGRRWNNESLEGYFQIGSALLMVAVALWMLWRTRRQERERHEHEHQHAHGHDEPRRIDTGHGVVRLAIFEDAVPPRFRLYQEHGSRCGADQVRVETERAGGARQAFGFVKRDGYFESTDTVPEPHEFVARLTLGDAEHSHNYDVEFVEGQHHHAIEDYERLDLSAPGYQDPHELAHANDIRRRFTKREVTTGQVVLFGLTGGLIPCPGSITVLLLCLQLKRLALGAVLVLCFSIGLALTMVASGALAALSIKQVAARFSGFGVFARRAPYFSAALILLVGFYMAYQGLRALG
jgi:nickel/cobalt exporter